MSKDFDSVLIFLGDEFVGEFPISYEGVPEDIYQHEDKCPFHLYRRGNDLICQEHPMMSPLPDLVITDGYFLPRKEAGEQAMRWWNDTYNGGCP